MSLSRVFIYILMGLMLVALPVSGALLAREARWLSRQSPDATEKQAIRRSFPRKPSPTCSDRLRQLRHHNPDKREAAVEALTDPSVCDPRRAVPALAERLSDPEVNVRLATSRALLVHGPRAAPAVPALIDAMKNPRTKAWSPSVLAKIGAPAVQPLIDALGDRRPHVRRSAAFVLGAIGEPAKPSVPTLRRLARSDPSWLVRRSARWAVVSIHGKLSARPGKAVISEMIRGLNDPEDQRHAVGALACQGKRAVPALIRALGDRKPQTRVGAAHALGLIAVNVMEEEQAAAAAPPLKRLAHSDPSPEVRRTATWAVEQLAR